jgi:hypothetical protein
MSISSDESFPEIELSPELCDFLGISAKAKKTMPELTRAIYEILKGKPESEIIRVTGLIQNQIEKEKEV